MIGRPVVPPVLYVPCRAETTESGQPKLDLRKTKDGRTALLVYTALDRLADGAGPNQPWVLVQTPALDELHREQAFDVVYLDLPIPEEHRWNGGSP